jgi:hypothetical protein
MQDASTALYTPLALDDVDSNGTCKSCAFFRRGPFCHFCKPGALKFGRSSRRRKRLKESSEAVENFMWFFIEGDREDRSFAHRAPEYRISLDSPEGIFLDEIIGRDGNEKLVDFYLEST